MQQHFCSVAVPEGKNIKSTHKGRVKVPIKEGTLYLRLVPKGLVAHIYQNVAEEKILKLRDRVSEGPFT